MRFEIKARGRRSLAGWALLLGGLLAACAPQVQSPAPVISGGMPERSPVRVTVQRGQSLSGIAHTYHVPLRIIAEANGLSPPYRIQAGRTLVIPDAGQPSPAQSVVALPPAAPGAAAAPVPPLEPPAPAQSESPPVTAAPRPPVVSPATAPAQAGASAPAPVPQEAPERSATQNPSPPAAHTSGAFLWPVRGRILASYGSRADGTHNDGINIGAPKGTPVEAANAGTVAYTGNELRGYGNLILIKHADGWISAYAHCDQILVKRGEKVARGQVIARVGSTGNVGEPQLHFELREGHKPVDPREFLAPLPVAATKDAPPG
jgi:murein DD-endopeptidase MepM/ murein hydrolase activator NlpD